MGKLMPGIDIKAAREICDKATPEPWRVVPTADYYSKPNNIFNDGSLSIAGYVSDENGKFIVFARTMLTQALDEIESMRRWNEDLQTKINARIDAEADLQRRLLLAEDCCEAIDCYSTVDTPPQIIEASMKWRQEREGRK